MKEKKKVLFLCTHNSARSQMAEGILRKLRGDCYDVYSAGIYPSGIIFYTKKVMEEIGIDVSGQRSKSIDEFKGMRFDFVITVCDQAKELCPFFPDGEIQLHKNFENPAKYTGDEALPVFRRVRDEIKKWIEETFKNKCRTNQENKGRKEEEKIK